MKENRVFKEGRRTPLIIGAFAVMIMLTLGVGVAQHQNANIARNMISEPTSGCGISFTGDEDYCPIASGAQYVLDGIASGELTFSELQAYIDETASGQASIDETIVGQEIGISKYQYSFDAVQRSDVVNGKDVDISSIQRESIQGFDVLTRLMDRLPSATVYCEEPSGDQPSDWHFNPQAICLSAGMTGIVGIAMATGLVSAFYALFGGIAWTLGMTKWVLTMEGFGLVPNAIQAGIAIYEACMDAFDGGQGQTG